MPHRPPSTERALPRPQTCRLCRSAPSLGEHPAGQRSAALRRAPTPARPRRRPQGGIYHGRIIMPAEYPFKPPAFVMLTPSGRFETNMKICLSISSHHPESWQPSWSVRSALIALIAFMQVRGAGGVRCVGQLVVVGMRRSGAGRWRAWEGAGTKANLAWGLPVRTYCPQHPLG